MREPEVWHPPLERLSAFRSGSLTEEQQEEIAAHLDHCAQCCERLETCDAPILKRLRGHARTEEESGIPIWDRSTFNPLRQTFPTDRAFAKAPTIPGYELLRELGRGGIGVVYEARCQKLGRVVALKVLLSGAHAGPNELARFRAEAETVARLRHPNIIQIYDVGAYEGLPYLSLEHVEGGTLSNWNADTPAGRRDAKTIAALMEQISLAVAYAHKCGVVHRDLKPSNVLLQPFAVARGPLSRESDTQDLAAVVPKIVDFGLAKWLGNDAGLTATGIVAGTPSYMSPEQAEGRTREIGPLTDVYALGAVLYELLTGRPPFQADTPLETIQNVTWHDPVAPRIHNENVPRDLEVICLKCLEKEPGRRYAGALELAGDLRRYLEGKPIAARPTGRRERIRKWMKREPAWASVLGLIAFLALVGFPGATALWLDAASARNAVEKHLAAEEMARGDAERHAAAEALAHRAALQALEASRKRLVRQYLAMGQRYADVGQSNLAALWFAQAWKSDLADPRNEADHQLRLAAALAFCPKLEGICFHPAPVQQALFLGSDERVLTRTGGPDAYVWNATQSQVIGEPLHHEGAIEHLAVSPNGRTVATSSSDRTVRLWNPLDKPALLHTLGHPGVVRHSAFSPDGKKLASVGEDSQVRLWSTADGGLESQWAHGGARGKYVGFSPDGSCLVILDEEGNASVWRISDRSRISPPLTPSASKAPSRPPGRRAGTTPLPQWSPDGRKIVVGKDEQLVLWDRTSGAAPWTLDQPLQINSATFHPSGEQLLLAGPGSVLRVIRLNGDRVIAIAHPRQVQFACFSPDGKRIASTSSGGLIHLWDAELGKPLGIPARDAGQATALAFDEQGRRLLTGCVDGTVRVWRMDPQPRGWVDDDGSSGSSHYVRNVRVNEQSGLMSFDPAGKRELRFGDAPGVRISSRSKEDLESAILGADEIVRSAFFSADGRRVIARGPNQVRVWEAKGGAQVGRSHAIRDPSERIFASRDAARLGLAGTDGVVDVWDVERGILLLRFAPPDRKLSAEPKNMVPAQAAGNSAEMSPDGTKIIVQVQGAGVQVYDIVTGKAELTIRTSGLLAGVEFSRDGMRMVAALSDTTARLWSLERREALGPPLRHPTFVRHAALAPDQKRVATFCADGQLRIWNGETGDLLFAAAVELEPQSGRIMNRLRFSKDGRKVVAFRPDGTAKQLELPAFTAPIEATALLLGMFTGQEIDETDGEAFLLPDKFIENREQYRKAWLSYQRGDVGSEDR